MSLKKIKKELKKMSTKNDILERIVTELAEFYVTLNCEFAIKQMGGGVIKKISFEDFIDEHHKAVLILGYDTESEGESIYVRQRINIINLEFEGEMYCIQCLHGNSLSCERIDGKRMCNFEVKYFLEKVFDVIEKLNSVCD